jgi:hypothetical protein
VKGIFISYRRADAAGWAGRLVADLGKHLPGAPVFQDIAAIGAGEDFAQAIERALGSCAVVLVMIGPNWLSARNRRGEARLDRIDDPVRVEIRMSLSRPDLLVVPVRVGGAAMPSRDELPDDLAALSTRNAAELSDARWDFDVARLVRQLTRIPGVVPRPQRGRRMVSVSLGLALVAMALVWYGFRPSKDELARPASIGANPITAEPEGTPFQRPEQPPIAVATPETKPEQARSTSGGKREVPVTKPEKIQLDGMWEADYPNAQGGRTREMFEFETRRGELFGSNWIHGGPGKFALLDGKVEEDRLKFCIRLPIQLRKGDGWEYTTYRECFDGIVARDEIRFIVTNYIDHPSASPETRTFTARRTPK